MKHTYLLIAALPSTRPLLLNVPEVTTEKIRRQLYNFLCLKFRGHKTESHQISTGCTEMIADCSAEIKIAIFQSVWKRQRDE